MHQPMLRRAAFALGALIPLWTSGGDRAAGPPGRADNERVTVAPATLTIDEPGLKTTASATLTVRLACGEGMVAALDCAFSGLVHVDYRTLPGTAGGGTACSLTGAGPDYVHQAGRIQVGGTLGTPIRITICPDRALESGETFVVKLVRAVDPMGRSVGFADSIATVTIR